MKKKISLAKYLKQKNKDLMLLRMLQESVTLLILHYVVQMYGKLGWKLEIWLLITTTSVNYFVMWQMFLKRNRDNIYLLFIGGNIKRKIGRIVDTIMFLEIVAGSLLGNVGYVMFQVITGTKIIAVESMICNTVVLTGVYFIISFIGAYITITRQLADMGAENERAIFHNI